MTRPRRCRDRSAPQGRGAQRQARERAARLRRSHGPRVRQADRRQAAEVVAAELQARTAQQLFQVLGELKGGAMKFGQALSIFEAAFPEEIAVPYRATLTKLQDSAPPMPTSSVHEVLRADFGTRWRSRFASFDDHPVASASIGQVHRGVWADGRDVAVKIQYPGAGAALMGDLRQISRVAKVAAGVGARPRPGADPRRAARPDGRGARLPPRGRVSGDLRGGLRRRRGLRRPRRRGRMPST